MQWNVEQEIRLAGKSVLVPTMPVQREVQIKLANANGVQIVLLREEAVESRQYHLDGRPEPVQLSGGLQLVLDFCCN